MDNHKKIGGNQMYKCNEPVNSAAAVECPVEGGLKSLTERATILQEKVNRIFSLAENIYGELYGHVPSSCEDGNNKPRFSLEETISETTYAANQLEACLSETLLRLRG
jgi:hypothetical protein